VALARKIRLGDLLVDKGLITEEQLQLALSEQKKLGRKLGRTLIELGMLDENVMLNMLADQLKIPLIDINSFNYNDDTANRLPESFARRYRALVLEERPRDYLVGMADPTDIYLPISMRLMKFSPSWTSRSARRSCMNRNCWSNSTWSIAVLMKSVPWPRSWGRICRSRRPSFPSCCRLR